MKTLHDLVADKLEQAGEEARAALLRIPLQNIDRWIANGHTSPDRLEQWRQIIVRAQQSKQGFAELLVWLRDPNEPARRLRDFSPFAGVRYRGASTELAALVAPPYDVIDDDQRAALEAADEHNAVRLILPRDASVEGDRYSRESTLSTRDIPMLMSSSRANTNTV